MLSTYINSSHDKHINSSRVRYNSCRVRDRARATYILLLYPMSLLYGQTYKGRFWDLCIGEIADIG